MPERAMTLPAPSPWVRTCWWRTRSPIPSVSKGSEPTTRVPIPPWMISAMAVGFWP